MLSNKMNFEEKTRYIEFRRCLSRISLETPKPSNIRLEIVTNEKTLICFYDRFIEIQIGEAYLKVLGTATYNGSLLELVLTDIFGSNSRASAWLSYM